VTRGMRLLVLAAAFAASAMACGKKKDEAPPAKDLGQAVGDTANDTALLREANGAANEVIRNATDCPAARASINAANDKLNALEPQLKTVTGRATLAALRAQVERVSQLCP
jgi:hypothetical protein